MGCNKFTKEQVEQLNKNPYVIKASEKAITYSEEFKQEFMQRYQAGKTPSEILRELGFNTSALKKSRIKNIVQRCKKYDLRPEGTADTRKNNSNMGRPRTKDLTLEEQVERLKHKNLVLEQENNFLKKMIYLAKRTKWEKSRLKKNTK